MAKEFINRGTSVFQTSPYLQVPVKVQKIIKDRGFYTYEWINENDLKNRLIVDFKRKTEKNSYFIILFVLIFGNFFITLIFRLHNDGWSYYLYFNLISIFIHFLIFFINYLTTSIKKILNISKYRYILLTHNSVLIGGDILKYSELDEEFFEKIERVRIDFQEELFGKSKIRYKVNTIKRKVRKRVYIVFFSLFIFVIQYFYYGYDYYIIYLTLIAPFYYLIYLLIYLFGTNFVLLLGKIKLFLYNRKLYNIKDIIYLIDLYTNKINNYNILIEEIGNKLIIILGKTLKEETSLNFNKQLDNGINNLNQIMLNILDLLGNFKQIINNSKYNDIIKFNVYDKWLKEQVKKVLNQIKDLLEENIKALVLIGEDINNKKREEVYSNKKGTLELAQKRVEMNLIYLEKNLDDIDSLIKILTNLP